LTDKISYIIAFVSQNSAFSLILDFLLNSASELNF